MRDEMNWYLDVIKNKYADFNGRARRAEYWHFILFNTLVMIGFFIIDMLIFGSNQFAVLYLMYYLFSIIPTIAVTFRRIHDIDKSAWWLLIILIPIIGQIILFIFTVLKGTDGTNRFGRDPLLESV
ncbi:DUF805 domain-containing protein [Sulfurimonas sp.]